MAFGFFKKKNYADFVYVNGNFDTKDYELPSISALAVKDGFITRVGGNEDVEDLTGPDTQVIDLEGRYAKPGIIDLNAHPAAKVLGQIFLQLSEDMSAEDVLCAVKTYIAENPDADYYFGWGFNAAKLAENEEDTSIFRKALDEICEEKPIILVSSDDLNMRINTVTAQAAKEQADEIGLETLTPAFIMDSVIATNYEESAKPFMEDAYNAAKLGITSRTCCEKSSYLDNIYRDILINTVSGGITKQRIFSTFPVKRMLPVRAYLFSMDRKATAGQEQQPYVNFAGACIYCSSEEASPFYMSKEFLKQLSDDVADKGYNIRYIPQDRQSVIDCLDIAGELSASSKKLGLSVEHNEELTKEELAEIFTGEAIELPLRGEKTAADVLGLSGRLGILREGAYADFAVFDNESDTEAYMTVLGGASVYTRGDSVAEWITQCNTLLSGYTDDITEIDALASEAEEE